MACRLLALPPELRLDIYDLVLGDAKRIEFHWSPRSKSLILVTTSAKDGLGLGATCRQIRKESNANDFFASHVSLITHDEVISHLGYDEEFSAALDVLLARLKLSNTRKAPNILVEIPSRKRRDKTSELFGVVQAVMGLVDATRRHHLRLSITVDAASSATLDMRNLRAQYVDYLTQLVPSWASPAHPDHWILDVTIRAVRAVGYIY